MRRRATHAGTTSKRAKASESAAARPAASKSSASDEAAWQLALRQLAARERSEAEVRTHLAAAGFPTLAVQRTMHRLCRLRYVDDHRLAVVAAERAAGRGQGSERVRAELERRGVDAAAVENAIASTFVDETQLARQVLERRFRNRARTATERARVARFLLARGFPEQVVLAIVGEGC